jgi:hypothetical protein
MTYPYIVDDPCGPRRTSKSMQEHAQDAFTKNAPVSFV